MVEIDWTGLDELNLDNLQNCIDEPRNGWRRLFSIQSRLLTNNEQSTVVAIERNVDCNEKE